VFLADLLSVLLKSRHAQHHVLTETKRPVAPPFICDGCDIKVGPARELGFHKPTSEGNVDVRCFGIH
jgi:hypothetical protein